MSRQCNRTLSVNVWSAMEDLQAEPPQRPDPPVSPVRFTVPGGSADAPLVDPHWVELSALVSRAEANRVEMSRLQAERAEVCADALELVALRVAQRDAAHPGRELGDTIPLREVLAELSTALRVGERTVSAWLGDGAALAGTFTMTLEALRQGRIDERHASAIIDAAAPLTPEDRVELERIVLPYAETETAPATRQHARIIAARLRPDIVDENHRRALAERRVRAFDLDDGLARLLLDGPAALIHGIYNRLTAMSTAQGEMDADGAGMDGDGAGADAAKDRAAEAEAGPGGEIDEAADETADERTLDQRRADVACDLLLTGAPAIGDTGLGAIRATVNVTIPILTLAGLDNEPALLDGEAPIDPDTARALAASAPCWQRVMTHPMTQEPLRLDTYRPSTRLRRLLAARDQHCRWPGCRRRAIRCDLDHTIPFESGGKTCAGNLEALCRKHHTLKHASAWTVIQLRGGVLEFTSPTGRTHRTKPPPVAQSAAGTPAWARYLDTAIDPADRPPF